MAGLIVFRPGLDWTATGGLFDWTLEYLIPRLSDKEAAERLHEIVDNNLGSLWISDFSPQTQHEVVSHLRAGLIDAAEQELPDTDRKAEVIQHLQELVDLTYALDRA